MTRGWHQADCNAATGENNFSPYPIKFCKDTSSSNLYAANDDNGISSQYTPQIVPVDSTIISATFSNRRIGVDLTAQLMAAPIGTQNSSAVTIINFVVPNKRFVCACFNEPVSACTKLALFVQDNGTNPIDFDITFWLKPVNCICVAGSDNTSSHFPSTGGTTST